MSLCCTPRIERIAQAVTGRPVSLFSADIAARRDALRSQITDRRVLVVGGAGSIGSATLLELLQLNPATVAVLDTSENNLAELIRTIRSQQSPYRGTLIIEPLDYGSPLTARWLEAQAPFDVVLSFAALKHVRSERDEWSLVRMLEVNLVKADRFLAALRRYGHGSHGVFFVSTDKAADPVSLMGASKRAMELLLWAHAQAGAPTSLETGTGQSAPVSRITTARFANVAFSDGSLPWGFLQRIEKRQALACPGDIRRYLVSPVEAGHICLLAALICPHQHVLVPRLDPVRDVVTFTRVAEETLREYQLLPAWYDDEEKARSAVETELRNGRYPVLVTRSDTSGEKDVERFIGDEEHAVDVGLPSAQAIAATAVDESALRTLLTVIARAADGSTVFSKAELVEALQRLVPALDHKETGRTLDGKM